MTREALSIVFMFTFVIASVIYSFLSAFTSIFYRNKYAENLSRIEYEIRNGKAGIEKRVGLFFLSLFSCFMFPPIYIIAGLVTFVAYLIT